MGRHATLTAHLEISAIGHRGATMAIDRRATSAIGHRAISAIGHHATSAIGHHEISATINASSGHADHPLAKFPPNAAAVAASVRAGHLRARVSYLQAAARRR